MLVLICWETLKSVAMAMNFGVPLLGYMNTVDKRLSKQVINQSTLQNEVAMAMTYILRFKGWCKHHWRHCHCRIFKTKSCRVYVNCQRATSLCSKTTRIGFCHLQQVPIKSLRFVYIQRSFYGTTVLQNGMKFLLQNHNMHHLHPTCMFKLFNLQFVLAQYVTILVPCLQLFKSQRQLACDRSSPNLALPTQNQHGTGKFLSSTLNFIQCQYMQLASNQRYVVSKITCSLWSPIIAESAIILTQNEGIPQNERNGSLQRTTIERKQNVNFVLAPILCTQILFNCPLYLAVVA